MPSPPEISERMRMLGTVPLLSGLTPLQLEKLATVGSEMVISGGVAIVREGELGLGFYLILGGTADVQRSGRTVASLATGQFFGESALLEAHPRTADVLATSQVRCWTLDRRSFWDVLGVDPDIDRARFEETVLKLRSSRGRLTE